VLAVARGNEEVYLKRTIDAAYEITEKDEASLEQPEYQQIPFGVPLRDFASQLSHSLGDLFGAVHNATNRTSIQPWINDRCAHSDT
jgi:hypothetical protein